MVGLAKIKFLFPCFMCHFVLKRLFFFLIYLVALFPSLAEADSTHLGGFPFADFQYNIVRSGESAEGSSVVSGTLRSGNKPLEGLIMANGVFGYSDPVTGIFEIVGVAPNEDHTIEIMGFVEGYAPMKAMYSSKSRTAHTSTLDMGNKDTSQSVELDYTTRDLGNGWFGIKGSITQGGMPVHGLIVANDQVVQSRARDGSFRINVPMDDTEDILIYGLSQERAPFVKKLNFQGNVSSNKNITANLDKAEPKENAMFLDYKDADAIVSFDEDTGLVVLSQIPDSIQGIGMGNVLACSPSPSMPTGLLRKITVAYYNAEGYLTLETIPAFLDDLFYELKFQVTGTLDRRSMTHFEPASDNVTLLPITETTERASLSMDFIDLDLKIYENDNIGIEGKASLEAGFTVNIDVDFGLFSVEEFKVTIEPSVGFDAEVTGTLFEDETTVNIGEVTLGTIMPVPGLVFTIPLDVDFKLKSKIELSVSFSVEADLGDYGFEYDGDAVDGNNWRGIADEPELETDFQISLGGELKAGPTNTVSFMLYNTIGPGLKFWPYGKIGAEFEATDAEACFDISTGVEGAANGTIQLFSWWEKEIDIKILEIEFGPIEHCYDFTPDECDSDEISLYLYDPSETSLSPGDSLNFSTNITNDCSGSQNFSVQPSIELPNGTKRIMDISPMMTIGGNDSIYQAINRRIPTGAMVGEHIFTISLYDLYGDMIEEESFNFTVEGE